MKILQTISLAALAVLTGSAAAQLSLTSAVDLAVARSPRVKAAQDDVNKSRAILTETKDVYIPNISVGAAIGDSFGYSTQPPTLFTFNSQSLVYNGSQRDFIRSAQDGLNAAGFALTDARETVAEDTALSFLALAHDSDREAVLRQESVYAGRLVDIASTRLDAGRDSALDLNAARLSAAQIHLSLLHAEAETKEDRAHLAVLIGVPASTLKLGPALPSTFPARTPITQSAMSPAVSAAFAAADAKQAQARGDARYVYHPQISLAVQYSLYATFSDSFKQLQSFNPNVPIGANNEAFGLLVTIPLFDKFRRAKAIESAADASRALHDAQNTEQLFLDGQDKLDRSVEELRARAEVAMLEQQRAQLQLDALLVELNAPPVEGHAALTPKDEQTGRIAEREKYLAVLDTNFQLNQAQIKLLRQTFQLESWLITSSALTTP